MSPGLENGAAKGVSRREALAPAGRAVGAVAFQVPGCHVGATHTGAALVPGSAFPAQQLPEMRF